MPLGGVILHFYYVNSSGKTLILCGWDYFQGGDLLSAEQQTVFIPPCFLSVDAIHQLLQAPRLLELPHHDGLYPQTGSPNQHFFPGVVLVTGMGVQSDS